MMFSRAWGLSFGATASSRSSITMSAPRPGAFSSIRTLLPGTASSLRCRRGGVWVIEHSFGSGSVTGETGSTSVGIPAHKPFEWNLCGSARALNT